MEQQQSSNDGQEKPIESESIPGGMLNEIYEQDDVVAYGKRLQEQIDKSPTPDAQWDNATLAKRWISERFADQVGRLIFAGTNVAIVLQRGDENNPNAALSFTNVTVSGELKSVEVMTLDKPYVALELSGSSIYYIDKNDGEKKAYDSNGPTFLTICHITNHELL